MRALAPDARKSEWEGTLAEAIRRMRALAEHIRDEVAPRASGLVDITIHSSVADAIDRVLAALELPVHRVSLGGGGIIVKSLSDQPHASPSRPAEPSPDATSNDVASGFIPGEGV